MILGEMLLQPVHCRECGDVLSEADLAHQIDAPTERQAKVCIACFQDVVFRVRKQGRAWYVIAFNVEGGDGHTPIWKCDSETHAKELCEQLNDVLNSPRGSPS